MINNMFKKCRTTLGLKNKQAQESTPCACLVEIHFTQ
ncbi:Uncharacterised protein [Yersinia frederiksenii]|nr:Uncharacterised protein [Yersinia frederiksenii]CNF37330.1 Uncharacterised protein [Yersinia frederiksenii]